MGRTFILGRHSAPNDCMSALQIKSFGHDDMFTLVVKRMVAVSLLTLSPILTGCQVNGALREAEAARIAGQAAEDDALCRRAGFAPGTDAYRFCRKERMLTR